MDAADTLAAFSDDPQLRERLVHREVLPERSARHADPSVALHLELLERVRARGIETLFTHQARAIDRLVTGNHVVVATGTASGKSLCYQLPIIDSVLAGRRDTALLVFPTKAL